MGKRIAVIGDSTTTGGNVITGEQSMTSNNADVALLGDKAYCPKCQSVGTIIEGAQKWVIHGKPVAYDGCIINCGCPVGTHRIVANKSFMFVDV